MVVEYQRLISGIEKRSLAAHAKAFDDQVTTLPVGGFYRYRFGGEQHAFEAKSIHMLQSAVGNKNYSLFKKYSEMIDGMSPINIRDLLSFKSDNKKLNISEIDSAQEIRKRLVAPGISLGAFVEAMFRVPGLGAYFVSSIENKDYPLEMSLLLMITVMFCFAYFIADWIMAVNT